MGNIVSLDVKKTDNRSIEIQHNLKVVDHFKGMIESGEILDFLIIYNDETGGGHITCGMTDIEIFKQSSITAKISLDNITSDMNYTDLSEDDND